MKNKEIQIKCNGSDYIDIDKLMDFQEEIKSISLENLEKLKNNIKTNGFILPLCVWKNNILDGHQRKKAILELVKEGWKISNIPIIKIQAETEKDAKKIVIDLASQYGDIDLNKLKQYINLHNIDTNRIIIKKNIIRITSTPIKLQTVKENLKPFKQSHILISFNPDQLDTVNKCLENLRNIKGIEFEHAEN